VKSPKDFESWYQRLIDANPEVSQGAENEFMTKLGQGQAMLDAEFALADAIAAIVSLRRPNTGSKLGIIPGGCFDGKGKGEGQRLIPGSPGVITGGNSTKLGKNMLEEMGLKRSQKWSGYQAQHVIPSEMENNPVIKKNWNGF
jgi:hypothetical protein